MPEFKNVNIIKKANVYFGGKVVSRTVNFSDGSRKTLGFMMPGEYSFDTQAAEIMEIMSGRLDILLPGEESWKRIVGGEMFHVDENSNFKLKVHEATDYCCSFSA
ncbi:MAG: hypothetical protein A6F71_03140 [Cycloclasticus sp. symbiont of Poecilosclerida sp. M]|nr:MAG: hypothetical protein A6F71_03140 [Cycloclasticus sp. symbiont of Poecilosclerida sp. M]